MISNIFKEFRLIQDDNFTSKEKDILIKNNFFFSANEKYIEIMMDIINGKSKISIRVLDWFVANYSKKNNTCYKIRICGKIEIFNVNSSYKNQLGGYSKKYFDPFCRKKKIIYNYKNKNKIYHIKFITSIGQLNFFQWAIRNKIIKYVDSHLNEIENDMKKVSLKNKERKKINNNSENFFSAEIIDNVDPIICSSEKINTVYINPKKKKYSSVSDHIRRQQLSKSAFECGIIKTYIPIELDFD